MPPTPSNFAALGQILPPWTNLNVDFRYLHSRPPRDSAALQIYLDAAVDAGIDVPIAPFFVDASDLQQSSSSPNGAGDPGGVTVMHFFLDFDDAAAQWKPATVAGTGMPHVAFQGGTVNLVTAIGVFVDNRARTRRRALLEIMKHEYRHVRDAIRIGNEMRTAITADGLVHTNLENRQPLERGMWQTWFNTTMQDDFTRRFDSWLTVAQNSPEYLDSPFRNADPLGGYRQIDTVLRFNYWLTRQNAAARALDSGPEYLQLGTDVGFYLQLQEDPALRRDAYGTLPPNVG